MVDPLGRRLREFMEYDMKPARDLLRNGEFGFLIGAVVEKLIDHNPYFWYRERRGKDQIVLRQVRANEMWIDLYDRGISRHLFIRGVHEPHATVAYRDALLEIRNNTTETVTILDIGSNIGYYALEAADALDDHASIFAFEPDPKNRQLLKRNIEQNGYDNQIDVSPFAVDDKSGERIFCRSTYSNWNRLARDETTGNVDELVEQFSVETTSVDAYLDQEGVGPGEINAVRMDLEGHELNVLAGMMDVLNANGPLVLFVEFHPDFGERDDYESALSTLERCGFAVRHADQYWNVLDIESFEELQDVEGSHVRIVFSRGV